MTLWYGQTFEETMYALVKRDMGQLQPGVTAEHVAAQKSIVQEMSGDNPTARAKYAKYSLEYTEAAAFFSRDAQSRLVEMRSQLEKSEKVRLPDSLEFYRHQAIEHLRAAVGHYASKLGPHSPDDFETWRTKELDHERWRLGCLERSLNDAEALAGVRYDLETNMPRPKGVDPL